MSIFIDTEGKFIGEHCFAGSLDKNSDIGKWFLANGDQMTADVNAVLYNKSSS